MQHFSQNFCLFLSFLQTPYLLCFTAVYDTIGVIRGFSEEVKNESIARRFLYSCLRLRACLRSDGNFRRLDVGFGLRACGVLFRRGNVLF